jgi:hypothetical protein
MKYPSWDRLNKNAVREMIAPSRKAKSTIWMPGEQCLDITHAWNQGLIHPKGNHVLVECNNKILAKIKRKMAKIPIDFQYHLGWLADYEVQKPVDYIHIDYCGGLDLQTARWIEQLPIMKRAEINFTFSYAQRNNEFVKRCHAIFEERGFFDVLLREFSELSRNDMNIAVYCCLLRCLLKEHHCVTDQPIYYKDTAQSMVAYRFRGFNGQPKREYPDLLSRFRKSRFQFAF